MRFLLPACGIYATFGALHRNNGAFMAKAAIVELRDASLLPAADSARNAMLKVVDFMYGSPDRVKITMAFAFALLIMGLSMTQQVAHGLAACPV
jgi:hypothetical protein